MFGKKSFDPPVARVVEEDVAKACDGCGCIVIVEKLHCVSDARNWGRTDRRYCGRCKPPYDRVRTTWGTSEVHFYRCIPERFVEVTEDGEEV